MTLAQLYFKGEKVFLKKMGLQVKVVDFHRGRPNRYSVVLFGMKMVATEKQLARVPVDLKFGRSRRNSKFKPHDLVGTKDEGVAVVLSSYKYRRGFRYKLATPSRNIVVDEKEIYKKKSGATPSNYTAKSEGKGTAETIV